MREWSRNGAGNSSTASQKGRNKYAINRPVLKLNLLPIELYVEQSIRTRTIDSNLCLFWQGLASIPSAVRLPQTASSFDMLVVACETLQPPAFPAVVDDASPAGRQGASNPTGISKCHNALASASTVSDLASVAPWIISPFDNIAVLFGSWGTLNPANQEADSSAPQQ